MKQKIFKQTLFSAILLAGIFGLSVFLVPTNAHATFPGQNGKLAFDDKIFDDGLGNMTHNITGINLDGSDSVSIASQGPEPIVGEEQLYIYSTMNYSADGSKIVFSMRDTISGTSNIYIANSDGSSRQQLTSYQQTDGRAAFYPHFSLDGSKIVYSLFTTTEDTTLAQIYTINNDGSGNGLFAISGSDNCDSHPVYSPDGTKIAFFRHLESDPESYYGIYIANSDGTSAQKIADTTVLFTCTASLPMFSYSLDWSPDGSKLVFTDYMSTEDTVETYIKTVTTESPYTATEVMSATGALSPGIGSSYISNPHYTPDGRIVFKEFDVYEGEDEAMMRNRIMLSHDDGSNSSYVDGTTRGSSASDFVGITFMGYLAVQPIPDDIEEPSENEVELTNAEDGKPIMLQTPEGTDISCNASIKESAQVDQDGEYDYPLGLVEFCFSTDNQNNTVSLTFVTNLTPDQVTARKYNPDNKIYFDIPGAEISQTTYQGQPALELSYDIEDNGQLDLDPSTGSIKDPVGLAVVDSDEELAGTGYDMKHLVAVVSVVTAILGLFTFGAVYKYKMS